MDLPSKFHMAAWEVIGGIVTSAVQEFFVSGCFLKEINDTLITLVPKCQSPMRVTGYRPIACCNSIYKIIAKILANRQNKCLRGIINPSKVHLLSGGTLLITFF